MENLYKNFIKLNIMSNLNFENIVGFKAVDKDGNEQNVTVDEMVDMVSTRMVMALSETSTFAAAAATGNDVYENELPTVTDAANVRVLQSSGDAAQMTMQSLASKLGGLIGVSTLNKNGLQRAMMSPVHYNISEECYIRISIARIYTSASFSVSCYAGGRNLFDLINCGGANEAIPTCMRVSGNSQLLSYYMKGTDIFIKPSMMVNSWVNIVPLTSEFSMTAAKLIKGTLDTIGLNEFTYK